MAKPTAREAPCIATAGVRGVICQRVLDITKVASRGEYWRPRLSTKLLHGAAVIHCRTTSAEYTALRTQAGPAQPCRAIAGSWALLSPARLM